MESLILVTGTPRSNVPLVGGVVNLSGARGGKIPRARGWDARDSFENGEISTSLVKPFMLGNGWDPRGQNPLPDVERCKELAPKVGGTWRRNVLRIFESEGLKGPAFYASPITALIWPIWAEAFPEARWVHVRRRNGEVIRACMKTGFMTGLSDRSDWRMWVHSYANRFKEIEAFGLQCRGVWLKNLASGDLSELEAVVRWARLSWNEERIRDFLAPILFKQGAFGKK